MKRNALALAAAGLLAAAGAAQQPVDFYNIDFEFLTQNNGSPDQLGPYGAALNQPGVWNRVQFDATGIAQVLPNPMISALVDINGTQTGVTVALTAPNPVPAPIGGNSYFPGNPPPAPPACNGWSNADIGLYDGVVFQDPVGDQTQELYDLTFAGLRPGTYVMFTYAKCEEDEEVQLNGAPFTIVNPLIPGVPARVIEDRCPGFPAIHALPHTFQGHVLTVPASGVLRIQYSTLDVFWGRFCLSGMQLRFLGSPGTVGANYCAANPNSTGVAATISAFATGTNPATVPPSASSSFNDLILGGTGLVPGQSVIFFYGPTATAPTPLQNGLLCVGGPFTRMLPPKSLADQAGATMIPVDNTVYGGLDPGNSRFFQLWYSDPGVGTGENLSDAIQIDFGL